MIHAKVLIVDELWCVLGTTNIDNRSFEHNDEVNVAMRDAAVAARLLQDYERDLAASDEVTLERVAAPPAVGKDRRAVRLDSGAPAVSEPARRARGALPTCGSPPTTSIAAAAWIAASSAARIIEVLREHRCRRHRAAGSDRRGAGGAGQAEEIGAGARHGLGDGAGAHAAPASVRQRRPQPLPDRASQPVRPVVADVRAARLPARRHRARRPGAAHLQRAPRHGGPRAAVSGRAARVVRARPPRQRARRSSSATSTSGCAGWRRRRCQRCSRASTSAQHLKRRRTYPGLFPVLHLDHIYYEGQVEVRGVEMPRTRKSLMASDHLPLVATLQDRLTAESDRR